MGAVLGGWTEASPYDVDILLQARKFSIEKMVSGADSGDRGFNSGDRTTNRGWPTFARLGLSFRPPHLQVGADKGLEIAVDDPVYVADFHLCAVIFD